jgi:transcriptional regulator with XRE-family HTH domain
MTLGERIHLLRRRRGWTQEELAALIRVPSTTLARIEQGETKNPHVNIVRQLADVLGTSTDYLLGRREDSGVEPQETAAGVEATQLTATPAGGSPAVRRVRQSIKHAHGCCQCWRAQGVRMFRRSLVPTALGAGALLLGLWLGGGSPAGAQTVTAQGPPGMTAHALPVGTVVPMAPPVVPVPPPGVPPVPPDPAPVPLQGPMGETAILHQATVANGDHCVTVVGQCGVAITCTCAINTALTTP